MIAISKSMLFFVEVTISNSESLALNSTNSAFWPLILAEIYFVPELAWFFFIPIYYSDILSKPSSMSRSLSHVASFATRVKPIYSVSINKNVTIAYLFKNQLKRLLLSINMKLELDFLMTWSLILSEWLYSLIAKFSYFFLLLEVIFTHFPVFK